MKTGFVVLLGIGGTFGVPIYILVELKLLIGLGIFFHICKTSGNKTNDEKNMIDNRI